MANGDDVSNYKEVTDATKTKLEASDAAWVRPPQSFIDAWNVACRPSGSKINAGKYNEATGYFELNDLANITYTEAINILNAHNGQAVHTVTNLTDGKNRTMIPQWGGSPTKVPSCDFSTYETVRMFQSELNDQTIGCFVSGSGLFGRCRSVRKWLDVIVWFSGNGANNNKSKFSFDGSGWVKHGHPFNYFRFRNTNFNVDCRYYDNIGIDSFEYLVEHRYPLTASDANPITVTVHPDVYAKLTGDEASDVVKALSDEDKQRWLALADLAVEKQVNFVTVEL